MNIFEKLVKKPVVVYGAGAIARVILPYILHDEQICLLGVAVTRDMGNHDVGIQEVSVKSIRDFAVYANEAVVLIATSQQYHAAIEQTCNELGFRNIMPLTAVLKDEIIVSYYQKYFAGRGISLDDPCLELGRMRFLNPLHQKIPNGANLFSQLGDLVLPHEYGDWRMVVEGPYDWDRVMLEPDDVVLDCGANMGVFSIYAASKGCTAYAFEPTPALHPVLEQHAKLNEGRLILEPYAVANQTGQSAFHLDPYSCGGSSLMVRSPDTVEVEVQQITLDEFVQQRGLERVDFIKADIEGAERLMLEGAQHVLADFAPKLSLCTYHLPDDKEVLTRLILQANPNYRISYRWQKLYAYV